VKPGLPYHEPVVVRWVMQRNGKMTPKRAKILKAKEGGSFAINAAETQECLEILSGLIKRRKEIKGRIFSIIRISHIFPVKADIFVDSSGSLFEEWEICGFAFRNFSTR
jgi:hypothetical protein